eukprot:7390241-Prymnesium_polylepis.1
MCIRDRTGPSHRHRNFQQHHGPHAQRGANRDCGGGECSQLPPRPSRAITDVHAKHVEPVVRADSREAIFTDVNGRVDARWRGTLDRGDGDEQRLRVGREPSARHHRTKRHAHVLEVAAGPRMQGAPADATCLVHREWHRAHGASKIEPVGGELLGPREGAQVCNLRVNGRRHQQIVDAHRWDLIVTPAQ